ncbi:hypothetical protein [Kitasatospora sp. SUK 42]|uniref:hypothetical protein n=1 Tax=Kitasatospora sp. SUK 42 TaxID=1588882 RepID=UPI001C31BB00|nr:hypothetical protein [Kitasatospora sp. SUK 42]MBV2153159.1 hypothetical protein [Kitasatospora sp. SUK 42]
MDKNLQYSGNATYQGYRTDCSGYASMAWKLGTPGLATPDFVPSGVASWLNSKEDLKPGDALLNDASGAAGHIAIFNGWTDGTHTSYDAYEFTGSGVHHRTIPYPYFSGYGTFKPVRNNSVIDATPSGIGVYRAADRTFYVADRNGADVGRNMFGNADDMPLVGHFAGPGRDTVGVYRPATQEFFLTGDNANVAVYTVFGNKDDVPLVGDWDGTGKQTIGVYRPSEGAFYLTVDNLTPKYRVTFGNPNWKPIVGNWSGTGKDTVGVYDPDTQTFHLSDANVNGPANDDHRVTFGNPDDVPIKGDWDGSGTDKVGVYRPSTQEFFGAVNGGQLLAKYGNPGDKPLTGHWN